MAKVEQFEDLRCWQEARKLAQDVYALSNAGPLRRDYRLRSQLTGAAVSVMSNIAEGFARYHRREFARFLDIAQSSAVEVKSLLYVALDQDYASPDRIADLQSQTDATKALTLGLIRYLNEHAPKSNTTHDPPSPYHTDGKPLQPHHSPPDLPDEFLTSPPIPPNT
jgi:four helix bundle protein